MISNALVLALALSADAFAVAVSRGAVCRQGVGGMAASLGAAFGFAQGGMALLGWGLAAVLSAGVAAAAFAAYDHWIAFLILTALGVKTIGEGLRQDTAADPSPLRWGMIAALALATSIDAAGAGMTFDPMGLAPLEAAAVIGAVTALVCACGVFLGASVGARLSAAAEIVGGIALILIGAKILYDHGVLGGAPWSGAG